METMDPSEAREEVRAVLDLRTTLLTIFTKNRMNSTTQPLKQLDKEGEEEMEVMEEQGVD